jgi:hypothetical protein
MFGTAQLYKKKIFVYTFHTCALRLLSALKLYTRTSIYVFSVC